MMDRLRIVSQGLIGRIVMAVILGVTIIGFGFWGIGSDIFSSDPSEVARAGSSRISAEMYRNAYDLELRQLEQSAKRGITAAEARQLGLERHVLTRLLSNAELDQEVKKLGLAIGDNDMAKTILKDGTFKGPDGKFDRARFDSLLRENGYTESRFVSEQRTAALRQYVIDAAIGGIEVPSVMSDAIHRYQAETRAVDFAILAPAAAGDIPAPTDAGLQKYFDDRKSAYSAPEFRKLVTLAVVPAGLVKPDTITGADVQKRYDDVKAARFVTPEKRTLQQIVYPTEAEATAAKAQYTAGTSFDDLAKARQLTDKDIDLGTVGKSGILEKPVAEAAFALPDGGVSDPVKTQFGFVLVKAVKIIPESEQPLSAVAGEMRDEIAVTRAKAAAASLRDKIEEQRTAGKSLSEAATAAGLQVRTIEAIDAQGRDKAGKPVEGIVDGPALLKAAFTSDVGADTEMLSTASGGYEWYEVANIDPAHPLTFAEAKPQAEAAWHKDQVSKRLFDKAGEMIKALNGGETMASLAAKDGLSVQHASDVRRGSGDSALPANVSSAVFSVAGHKAGSSGLPDGGRAVFQVESTAVPPLDANSPEFKKLIEQVKAGLADDVLSEYLTSLEQSFPVKVNARALATAAGSGDGS